MSASVTRPVSSTLAQLRERAGMSMEEVAKAAGYRGRSSVQRYFEDPTIMELSPKIVGKLAAAFVGRGSPPIQPADLLVLAHADADHTAWLGHSDLNETARKIFKLPHHGSSVRASGALPVRSGMMPVMGTAQASNWMEQSPSLDEPEDWIAIPNEHYSHVSGQYVLRIVGPSINRVAPDGHYAICQRYGDGKHSLLNGKYVHVERLRGDFVEWTIKRVRIEKDLVGLWPDSDHPEHQDAIEFGGNEATVRILGIVTGWYRPA